MVSVIRSPSVRINQKSLLLRTTLEKLDLFVDGVLKAMVLTQPVWMWLKKKRSKIGTKWPTVLKESCTDVVSGGNIDSSQGS